MFHLFDARDHALKEAECGSRLRRNCGVAVEAPIHLAVGNAVYV
jgi:hypothetical protein